MTKRRQQSNQSLLKTLLVLGSVAATFVGGELLANQATVSEPTPIVVMQGNSVENGSPDAPILQLEIPNPITKSKSSK